MARSIILTATDAMAGSTQLFEGAHLTGGNTRFCRESRKCRNHALFVGQIIKWAPFKQKFWLKCAPSIFLDSSQIDLIYVLLSQIQIQLCRNYALFEGHFWLKFVDGGHQNILMDRGGTSIKEKDHKLGLKNYLCGALVSMFVCVCRLGGGFDAYLYENPPIN